MSAVEIRPINLDILPAAKSSARLPRYDSNCFRTALASKGIEVSIHLHRCDLHADERKQDDTLPFVEWIWASPDAPAELENGIERDGGQVQREVTGDGSGDDPSVPMLLDVETGIG